jgi:hypothetical protein
MGDYGLIPPGRRYEANVADTLDLAERARVALHGLAGSLDPEGIHEMYFIMGLGCRPPFMYKDTTGWPTNNPKFAESFPMMRVMSGSDHAVGLEADMMRVMREAIGDDGLYYAKTSHARPWHEGVGHVYPSVGEDFANTYGNARMLLALMAWHARSPGPDLWKTMERMAHGLADMAIDRGDYAYYPDGRIGEAFSRPRSGWRDTTEPAIEKMGAEGSMFMYHGGEIRALSRWHAMSADRRSIEMAGKLVRFVLKRKFWGVEAELPALRGVEHGHFHGHFHAHLSVLRGLLEYAAVTRDQRIVDFVRESYEYARHFGVPQLGWFAHTGWCEGCTLGDMIALGARLSDLGAGDYWEDVEQVVRNRLAEQQLVDPARLRAASDSGVERGRAWNGQLGPFKLHPGTLPGQTVTEGVLDRALGVFAGCSRPDGIPWLWTMQCCTGNGTQGLYYAWESIVRGSGPRADAGRLGALAQVNLLLNRASPWVDIDSFLPIEGRVVIRARSAERVAVHMPRWASPGDVKVTGASGGQWIGRYLLADFGATGVIELGLPLPEQTTTYTVDGTTYTCRFRGHDCVGIEPRSTDPGYYPMYVSAPEGPARTRTIERYVTSTILPW